MFFTHVLVNFSNTNFHPGHHILILGFVGFYNWVPSTLPPPLDLFLFVPTSNTCFWKSQKENTRTEWESKKQISFLSWDLHYCAIAYEFTVVNLWYSFTSPPHPQVIAWVCDAVTHSGQFYNEESFIHSCNFYWIKGVVTMREIVNMRTSVLQMQIATWLWFTMPYNNQLVPNKCSSQNLFSTKTKFSK